jgi:hypothetical protein
MPGSPVDTDVTVTSAPGGIVRGVIVSRFEDEDLVDVSSGPYNQSVLGSRRGCAN